MNVQTLKRVRLEIEQVNSDFFNLRTVISPDPKDDITRFYFMMLPNDGAMAHQTLVGNIYITPEYPQKPPVVQLFTPTQRYNVDVYRHQLYGKTNSSMCFDILRSDAHGGTWKPEFTLSCLFASLMSALVSYNVTQQSGQDLPQPVSMAILQKVKMDAKRTYEQYRDRLPNVPTIPLVRATEVPATSLFPAPDVINAGAPEVVSAGPIYLQNDSNEMYSFAVDLSDIHADIVFSVILSNSMTDHLGKKQDTILVRNGVTATAARKRAQGKMVWFYHGKPMNDGDMRLHVTIGRDQMTFAYYSNGELYVHGDCPVSRLSVDHIGDVGGVPFYVHIYTKNKAPKKHEKEAKVTVLDIEGKGYIYEPGFDDEGNDFGFETISHDMTEEQVEHDEPSEQSSSARLPSLLSRLSLR